MFITFYIIAYMTVADKTINMDEYGHFEDFVSCQEKIFNIQQQNKTNKKLFCTLVGTS